jgi:hypothetical protein
MSSKLSEAEYIALLEEIQPYFENNPEPGSPEARRFVELVDLISSYEDNLTTLFNEPKALALIEFEVRGIECDNERCDFGDPNVLAKDFPIWINKPCPKCGSNLLTYDDWELVDRMMAFTNLTNELAAKGALGFAQPNSDGTLKTIALELDHTGVPRIIRHK